MIKNSENIRNSVEVKGTSGLVEVADPALATGNFNGDPKTAMLLEYNEHEGRTAEEENDD